MRAVLIALLVVLVAGAANAQYPPPPPPSPPAPSPPGQPSVPSAVKTQAKVAVQHAGFAAQAQTVSSVREHLRHVLVCIEGPKGAHVDPAWANPCQGLGNGVLVDLQRARNPSLLNIARTADNATVAGVRSNTLARMKAAAKEVAALMTRIAQAK